MRVTVTAKLSWFTKISRRTWIFCLSSSDARESSPCDASGACISASDPVKSLTMLTMEFKMSSTGVPDALTVIAMLLDLPWGTILSSCIITTNWDTAFQLWLQLSVQSLMLVHSATHTSPKNSVLCRIARIGKLLDKLSMAECFHIWLNKLACPVSIRPSKEGIYFDL